MLMCLAARALAQGAPTAGAAVGTVGEGAMVAEAEGAMVAEAEGTNRSVTEVQS